MTIRLDNGSTGGGGAGVTDHSLLSNLTSATAGHTGYQATILSSNLVGTAPIGITGGTGSVLSATTITISTATAGLTGALASGDWSTFNSKQATIASSNLTTVAPISISGGVGALLSGTTLSMAAASTAADGYLTSANFSTFFNKQATITSQNIIGSANQVLVSGGSGSLLSSATLSLPQSIGTASTVKFSAITGTSTGNFSNVLAGASIFTSITANIGVNTSSFFGLSITSGINAGAVGATSTFGAIGAGASIFTSITATLGTSYLSVASIGILSITTSFTGNSILTSTPTNLGYSGTSVYLSTGQGLTGGDLVYYKSDGKIYKAIANSTASMPCIALAMAATMGGLQLALLNGFYQNAALYAFSAGGQASAASGLVYVSQVTSALATQTRPATASSGNIVQIVGYASTADILFFNPDYTYVEIL